MQSIIEFQQEEYEKLIEILGLKDNNPKETDDTDYFNAWFFGKREEDFLYTNSSSVQSMPLPKQNV